MNAPFGMGSFDERRATMRRRMSPDAPHIVFHDEGPCITRTARVDRYTNGEPLFVFIEYGFVMGGNEPHTDEGRYDTYVQIGMPLDAWNTMAQAVADAQ